MSEKLTEIAIILDRSGSMQNIKDDMEGSIKQLIKEQLEVPGRCQFSLYQFDDVWEKVFEEKTFGDKNLNEITLVPRGTTALFDAIVKSLSAIENRLNKKSEKPNMVFVAIITDGAENASKEVTNINTVKEAIDRCSNKLDWKFTFLASDTKGFAQGTHLLKNAASSKVSSYRATGQSVRSSVTSYSNDIRKTRTKNN